MNERGIVSLLINIFSTQDSSTWTVLLIAAYFLLHNGCIRSILEQEDNRIIWIIIHLVVLFMYTKQEY